jgi:hypothetical protein
MAKAIKHTDAWDEASTSATTGKLTGKVVDVGDIIMVFRTATDVVPDADDPVLDPVDPARIYYLRQSTGLGGYGSSKLYAAVRDATTTAADVNRVLLELYPAVASEFIGMHYIPQFTVLADGETPNVNDLESRDIAYIAAMRLAPLMGRASMLPSIALMISRRTQLGLERKIEALLHARQDK